MTYLILVKPQAVYFFGKYCVLDSPIIIYKTYIWGDSSCWRAFVTYTRRFLEALRLQVVVPQLQRLNRSIAEHSHPKL